MVMARSTCAPRKAATKHATRVTTATRIDTAKYVMIADPFTGPTGWDTCAARRLLVIVAICACWIPTRRAIRVDPISVIRTE